MNNQLFLILFWILASCGMPVSSLYQDKVVSVVSAEKNHWSGGRAGVGGILYTITLKKKNNKTIKLKTLRAEGNTIPFAQTVSGNTITIKGNYSFKNSGETMTADHTSAGNSSGNNPSQDLNPKDNWITYTVQGSETLHKISIPAFTSVEPSGELAP